MATLPVVIFTLARSLYLREVLGDNIARSVDRALLGLDLAPRWPKDDL